MWTVGFVFEALGDYQLSRFKKDPANAGLVMDRGLWAWTRHPNYFGDVCVWVGLWLLALGHPGGLVTVVAPLLMGFFLVRVSGKALLEEHAPKPRRRMTPTSPAPVASFRARRDVAEPAQHRASTSAIACFSLADNHSP